MGREASSPFSSVKKNSKGFGCLFGFGFVLFFN